MLVSCASLPCCPDWLDLDCRPEVPSIRRHEAGRGEAAASGERTDWGEKIVQAGATTCTIQFGAFALATPPTHDPILVTIPLSSTPLTSMATHPTTSSPTL